MIEGHTTTDILDAIARYFPKRDAAALLKEALDLITDTGAADHQTLRGWCLEAYQMNYRKMHDAGDYQGALKAVKEIWNVAKP